MDSTKAIWYASIAVQIGVAARLTLAGLVTRFPALFSFLVFSVARDLLVIPFFKPPYILYERLWKFTEPLLWCLYIWLAAELFSRYLEHYPGLSRRAAQIVAIVPVLAIAVAAFTIPFDAGGFSHLDVSQSVMLLGRRIIATAIAIFCVSAAAFFSMFRIPHRPNVRAHFGIMTFYFTVNALGYFAANRSWFSRGAISEGLMLFALGTYVCWGILLTRDGETVRTRSITSDKLAFIKRWDERLYSAGRAAQ